MSIAADAILPFTLRLNAIEAKLLGTPSSTGASLGSRHGTRVGSYDGPDKVGESSKTALRRVREIQEGLERAGEENDGLKRLVGNYETYSPLLSLSDSAAITMLGGGQGADAGGNRVQSGPSSEWDVIPDSVKVTMILEAAADIKGADRDLRQVEVLKGNDVEGAGELEGLLFLRPELQRAQLHAKEQAGSVASARKETADLLGKYNDYTAALSDLFLDVHRRLETMEEDVARAERRKRRELAERY